MSVAIITPRKLSGTVAAPPSKSDAHRAIICALLSRGVCEINLTELSDDILATVGAARAFGALVKIAPNRLVIDACGAFSQNNVTINCNESASTLRFFVPIASAYGLNVCFEGGSTLVSRPMNVYKELLPKFGVRCVYSGKLPFKVSGQLRPGRFEVAGDVSSQFISGLLLALPLLDGDSEIILKGTCESAGYVDMTVKTMARFGVRVIRTEEGFLVPGNQKYQPTSYLVEGDWSQAAFFLAAGAIGLPVRVSGLKMNSTQGDSVIVEILRQMGANVRCGEDYAEVSPSGLLGIDVFAAQIPDLVPILAVLGACAKGTTRIFGAARLRYKESDRLLAMCSGLRALGVSVARYDDGLVIEGRTCFEGANLNGFYDHRIVMALAIAAVRANSEVRISNAESISKSYPSFFAKYSKLGGDALVIDV